MKSDRDYFYELVDKIPESKLEELRKTLLIMSIPEETPTAEEREAIRQGKEQIANGDFTHYATFEEMEKDIMGE